MSCCVSLKFFIKLPSLISNRKMGLILTQISNGPQRKRLNVLKKLIPCLFPAPTVFKHQAGISELLLRSRFSGLAGQPPLCFFFFFLFFQELIVSPNSQIHGASFEHQFPHGWSSRRDWKITKWLGQQQVQVQLSAVTVQRSK